MSVLFNNQSCYSILESSLRINEIIDFAKKHSYSAIGICDYDNLFATMPFYHGCKKAGIKPIIGIRVLVEINEKAYSYLIIAKDNLGFQELIKLSTYLNSFDKKLTLKQLKDISGHCFIISDCEKSYVYDLLDNESYDELTKYINYVKSLDHWYIGVGPNMNNYMFNKNVLLSRNYPDSLQKQVCVDNAKYSSLDYYEPTKVLLAIKHGTTVNDKSLYLNSLAYLKDARELNDLYDKVALDNTEIIANRVHLDLEVLTTGLPTYTVENNQDTRLYLSELATIGLRYRFNNKVSIQYQDRLNYELKIINEMGFHNYFLIIYDIIKNARKKGIYIGPGRGSVVGSLVSYCLGITHIDPIENGLLFERFLNPERVSLPDIDIDIPDNRRNEVIQYVKDKYGNDFVANIIAFNTLQSKAVIRDVAKALAINTNLDIINNKIIDSKISLQQYYQNDALFRQSINADDKLKRLYDISIKLEGLPRTTTMHAAGIVMAKDPLTSIIPLIKNGDTFMTQYEKDYLEEMGLIKFDLLGVKNLNIIDNIANSIQPKLDVLKLPLDDLNTYELLRKGDTNGIFQLEQVEARKTLMDIHPSHFDDIAMVMALIRPGAKQSIPEFLENKANPAKIQYIDPSLKDILKETYGMIIYQEQIMQLAVKVAGFSLGMADILRKSISKKNSNEIAKLKETFISNALKNGYQLQVAERIYDAIYRFGEYGFNKSHAMAYGLIVYQQAYLKANFPINFYCESLNLIMGNHVKSSSFIKEMRLKGIQLLPPDINKSNAEYSIENGSIRFPLAAIKDISSNFAGKIMEDRNQNGQYQSYYDFYYRSSLLGISDREKLALIHSGALDCFGISHSNLIEDENHIANYINISKRIDNKGNEYVEFEKDMEPILALRKDYPSELLERQFEYLGIYLNGHPTTKYFKQYPEAIPSYIVNNRMGNVTVIGMISSIKEITTKRNEKMAFISINDEYGSVELALMPSNYSQVFNDSNSSKLQKNDIVYVKGKRNERNSVVIQSIKLLEEGKNGKNTNRR